MEHDHLADLGPAPPPERGLFCNRTLNLGSIRAIGYDMDYTLIHYRVDEWERRAYEYIQRKLAALGWPVEELRFDPELVVRGLVIDTALGNLLKCNRFGYVKRAMHGTRLMSFDELRATYARTLVDLSEPRYVFLNTLFSISEGTITMQLVDLLEEGRLPRLLAHPELYEVVRRCVDEAHLEGELKADIIAAPELYVELDPEVPLALLDQRDAGKRLVLITNSEWEYTRPMMEYAFDRFLPGGMVWRDLFELVIVSARKPAFFASPNPLFEVIADGGLLRPCRTLATGGLYFGGHAGLVERHLGLSGEEILYVGDHVFVDVHMSKSVLRWRTALVLRELEAELKALEAFRPVQARLVQLMHRKEALEQAHSRLRLSAQHTQAGIEPELPLPLPELRERMTQLRASIRELDQEIGPLARHSDELVHARWGPLMRAGNDKSHLARQVERYADIYMSRVSNFRAFTPFVYLRSPRGSLPHDSLEQS